MRILRQSLTVSVLILTLSCAALAGEMTTGVAPPKPEPTPAQASVEMSATAPGDMHTGSSAGAAAGGVAAEAVLSLVRGVLSLL